ncbi:MAG: hypothetical protein IPP94_02930 [Ignavibacteria bacterium]|nr:hypothetical protein [Ignavibacteria bacterium]
MTSFRNLLALVLLAVMLAVAGCYYDKEEVLSPQRSAPCDTTAVTFSRSIAPLLSIQCAGCHSNANAPSSGDNIRLQTHADVKAQLSKVLGSVQWKSNFSAMPKNGAKMSDCQIRTLQIWADAGALDN